MQSRWHTSTVYRFIDMIEGAPTGLVSGLALLALVGCTSLPTIDPNQNAQPVAPTALQGPRGPLSAEKSKAIFDRLKQQGKDGDAFERLLAIEQALIDTPLTSGNQVALIKDGPATYRAMLAAIAGARDHINMETFIFESDEVGERFSQALIDKQKQGVQVNLIRDSAGTFSTAAAFFQRLSDAGIKVLEYNPVNPLSIRKGWDLNQRDHRKLLIVDGRIAIMGGINISGVYSRGSFGFSTHTPVDSTVGWRDTDVQLQGPVVAELQKMFLATWANQKGDALLEKNYFPKLDNAGAQVMHAIGRSPDETYNTIYAALVSAIGAAQTSVHLTNAYFAPDVQLIEALENAAKRGVDVKIILPSNSDSWLAFYTGRSHYTRLLKAGVKIFERNGGVLHSKTALIDGVWTTVGSSNLDWRSFLHNQELNAVILGADFGSQVQAMFADDLAVSQAIALEDWQRRSLHLRAKEFFASTWEYWL